MLQGHELFKIDAEKLIEVYNLIEKIIVEDPPFSIREGGIIKDGYNKELDELRRYFKSRKRLYSENRKRRKRKNRNKRA